MIILFLIINLYQFNIFYPKEINKNISKITILKIYTHLLLNLNNKLVYLIFHLIRTYVSNAMQSRQV